ncbi:hypothetical protein HK097_006209 [Rhizophlyctis rosea]|uniref:Uncharacterized protein n=1 Tax=Rhizophlyctis rosea TaxID=64517 RepID=A0AAD5SKS4_9FUNG|nr:hypothetical protein HK097_006209 [Rhizophlyctis rosea]
MLARSLLACVRLSRLHIPLHFQIILNFAEEQHMDADASIRVATLFSGLRLGKSLFLHHLLAFPAVEAALKPRDRGVNLYHLVAIHNNESAFHPLKERHLLPIVTLYEWHGAFMKAYHKLQWPWSRNVLVDMLESALQGGQRQPPDAVHIIARDIVRDGTADVLKCFTRFYVPSTLGKGLLDIALRLNKDAMVDVLVCGGIEVTNSSIRRIVHRVLEGGLNPYVLASALETALSADQQINGDDLASLMSGGVLDNYWEIVKRFCFVKAHAINRVENPFGSLMLSSKTLIIVDSVICDIARWLVTGEGTGLRLLDNDIGNRVRHLQHLLDDLMSFIFVLVGLSVTVCDNTLAYNRVRELAVDMLREIGGQDARDGIELIVRDVYHRRQAAFGKSNEDSKRVAQMWETLYSGYQQLWV